MTSSIWHGSPGRCPNFTRFERTIDRPDRICCWKAITEKPISIGVHTAYCMVKTFIPWPWPETASRWRHHYGSVGCPNFTWFERRLDGVDRTRLCWAAVENVVIIWTVAFHSECPISECPILDVRGKTLYDRKIHGMEIPWRSRLHFLLGVSTFSKLNNCTQTV